MNYRVYIQEPGGYGDPFSQHADIYVTAETYKGAGHPALLGSDGVFVPRPEGSIAAPTLRLPAEALPALIAAVEGLKGYPMNAVTEASVLREWLKSESERVDRVLYVAVKP